MEQGEFYGKREKGESWRAGKKEDIKQNRNIRWVLGESGGIRRIRESHGESEGTGGFEGTRVTTNQREPVKIFLPVAKKESSQELSVILGK